MATALGTVAVNAAFFQEVKDENEHLRDLLAKIRRLAEQGDHLWGHSRQLVDLFDALCDQLALQFSLEESYGYFEDAVEHAPRLSERTEALRNEHVTLFDTMRKLADDAQDAFRQGKLPSLLTLFAERFLEFDAELEQHDCKERTLIMESSLLDIGVGD